MTTIVVGSIPGSHNNETLKNLTKSQSGDDPGKGSSYGVFVPPATGQFLYFQFCNLNGDNHNARFCRVSKTLRLDIFGFGYKLMISD